MAAKTDSAPRGPRILAAIFKYLPLGIYAALIAIVFIHRKELTVDMLLNYTPSQPLLAFLFLMAAFAFKSVSVFLALHLLYATSALLFPPPLALFASTLGTFLTISIPYFIARRRGASYADKLKLDAHPFIQKIARTMSDAPLRFVLMIRFVGLFPCDLVSAYFGAKRTPYAAYALGSVIGFLPSIVGYTIMTATVDEPGSPAFLCAAGLIVGSTLCSLVIAYRLYREEKRREENADAE